MPEVPRGPTSCDLAFSPKRTPRPPFQERWTRGALARRRLYFWPLTPQEAAFVLGTSFTAALRRWVLALLVLLLHAYDLLHSSHTLYASLPCPTGIVSRGSLSMPIR